MEIFWLKKIHFFLSFFSLSVIKVYLVSRASTYYDKTWFRQVSRQREEISHLWSKYTTLLSLIKGYFAFSASFFLNLHQNIVKTWKQRIGPAFGVCSTQMLVEVYFNRVRALLSLKLERQANRPSQKKKKGRKNKASRIFFEK